MSFFEKKGVESVSTSFSQGSNEPIPKDTKLLAYVESASLEFKPQYSEDEYISLQWRVHAPDEYQNRVVFQKLRVNDPAKSARAWQMLAAIDANCGGQIAKFEGEHLDDVTLQTALISKPMLIQVDIWELNDRKGNWVKAVASRSEYSGVQPKKEPEVTPIHDDDVPF